MRGLIIFSWNKNKKTLFWNSGTKSNCDLGSILKKFLVQVKKANFYLD